MPWDAGRTPVGADKGRDAPPEDEGASSVCAPIVVWRFMVSNSSSVSLPGLSWTARPKFSA